MISRWTGSTCLEHVVWSRRRSVQKGETVEIMTCFREPAFHLHQPILCTRSMGPVPARKLCRLCAYIVSGYCQFARSMRPVINQVSSCIHCGRTPNAKYVYDDSVWLLTQLLLLEYCSIMRWNSENRTKTDLPYSSPEELVSRRLKDIRQIRYSFLYQGHVQFPHVTELQRYRSYIA